jgi:hypothetical protein
MMPKNCEKRTMKSRACVPLKQRLFDTEKNLSLIGDKGQSSSTFFLAQIGSVLWPETPYFLFK